MALRWLYRGACLNKYSVVVNIEPVKSVSDEDISIKSMHQQLDYKSLFPWLLVSWGDLLIFEVTCKMPDVARCNQPLPETQSLLEEAVSKYHECVLKALKAVQPSWKWMFTSRNDERVCTINKGIKVSRLWIWTGFETISITAPSRFPERLKSWIL